MPLPDICVEDREICANERAVLRFQQRTGDSLTVGLRNQEGQPLVLDAQTNKVCFIAKDYYTSRQYYIHKDDLTISDPAAGYVVLELEEDDLPRAGLYLAEFIVYAVDTLSNESSSSSSIAAEPDRIIRRVPCYLESAENVETLGGAMPGLTIAEVRLAMRDRCREDNFLLDSVEFTDSEIAWAIRRPVDYWNEIPPPLSPTYNPTNFPYRYHWVGGVIGELLRVASLNEARNSLSYSAANLTVADKDRGSTYLQTSEMFLNEYRTWVRLKKRAINMTLAYGSSGLRAYGNTYLTVQPGT